MAFTEFEEYLKLEKNYSPHTLKAYLGDLHDFSRFVEEQFEVSDLQEVDYPLIRSWIVLLMHQQLSNRSINRKISSLQAYYKFLQKTDQLKTSPLAKHKSLKTAKKVQIPFSKKEMEKIQALPRPKGFEETRDRFIIELFYSTGIRRAELIDLKVGDLNSRTRMLKVKGKGNKERLVPLIPSVMEALETYLKERSVLEEIVDGDCLFLTAKGRKTYPMLIYRVVNDYFRGISTKTKTSPHILRHSFATHLLNQGADINAIKSLLGHESLSSTQVYTHNDIAALRKVYGHTHPRSEKPGDQ